VKKVYFDTAYLCKLRWTEAGSQEVAKCARGADALVCAKHGKAEFYASGHRKVREGVATREIFQVVVKQFEADCACGAIQFLDISDEVIARVSEKFLAAPETLYLRAADALHLACAKEYGFDTVYSSDRHLLAAAAHFGIQGLDVIPKQNNKPG
jgi:predicted nucleic acid-binding protein